MQKALQYISMAKSEASARPYATDAPNWVKMFFHPRTLAETHALTRVLLDRKEWFLLACVLGILHHQRPGFLSYPSSHLVPYLRVKKFPRSHFRDMYGYRDVEPRLLAKVHRAYRRMVTAPSSVRRRFTGRDIRNLKVSERVDLLLTSPPYMNALDYGRDNRLRLWFLGLENYRELDRKNCGTPKEFAKLIWGLRELADGCLAPTGRVVLVIGEVRRKSRSIDTAEIVTRVMSDDARFRLVDSLEDLVPDLRRCRRQYCGTKREWVLVFRRN